MNSRSRILTVLLSSLGMLVLILDTRTALLGAAEGVQLCLRTVIPSLFPFFVLSAILTSSLIGAELPFARPVGRLCGIPKGAESLLVIGFLGGYPVGAQCIAQAYKSGSLSRQDAHRMLGFCSNAGPAFLFGMTGIMFESPLYPWILFAILILSALTVGILLPGKRKSSTEYLSERKLNLPQALHNALRTTAGVCGWIILFRVLLAIFDRWLLWVLPETLRVGFTGLCELSNGILVLAQLTSEPVRFVLCAAMLSLGGLCIGMQTISVVGEMGTGLYFPGKLAQCCISTSLSMLTAQLLFDEIPWSASVYMLPILAALLIAVFGAMRRKIENNSSIQETVGV